MSYVYSFERGSSWDFEEDFVYSPLEEGEDLARDSDDSPEYVECKACYGTGIDPESDDDMTGAEWPCERCDGYGNVER